MPDWFTIANADDIASPALLIYPERVQENIRRMIRIAGGVARLRPHVKTHKLAQVVQMHLKEGIAKFKCATIAEAEMAATADAQDVLLAYPAIGPNVHRLLELIKKYPATQFSCVADDEAAIRSLGKVFAEAGKAINVLLDIDCGQHRTGAEPGAKAAVLYRQIASTHGLHCGGFHVYDGHIHESDLAQRTKHCTEVFAVVTTFCDLLRKAGAVIPRIVAGGTPTFPIHARNEAVECSPGTCVLWDFGYERKFPDLDFLHAAVVMARVVSKPAEDRLCLDLGYKAVASENPSPRVRFFGLTDAEEIAHNEEHLVLRTDHAHQFNPGDCLFGIPRHICPTVALYSEAVVIRDGRAVERWKITARDRRITI